MKKDFGNFLAIIFISSVLIYIVGLLLKKYYFLTFEHFTASCAEAASRFLSSPPHYIGLILTILIILGITVFFIKSLISITKTQIEVNMLLKSPALRVKISDDRAIVVHADSDLAITIGWFHPRIIISDHLISKLKKKELEAVILHESYHLKRWHPFLLTVAEIMASSLFFVPIMRDLTRNLKIILEKEADNFVARNQKGSIYLDLALEKVSTNDKFNLFPTFSKRNDFRFRKSSIISSILIAVVITALFLLPTQTHADSKIVTPTSKCSSNQCSINCP